MKNFNNTIILLGILSGSILLVENMVLSQQAIVYIFQSSSSVLTIASMITGMVLGFGIKGKIYDKNNHGEDDSFNF